MAEAGVRDVARAVGIKPDDIADPELATLWRALEKGYREMAPLIAVATRRLDVAA